MNHNLRNLILVGISGLLAAGTALGQTTQPTPGPTPAGGIFAASTEPASTAPSAGSEAAGEGVNESAVLANGKIILNFRNASLDAVLKFLSQAGGFTIINDFSGDTKLDGRVNALDTTPMTIEDALNVFNTILKDRGYAVVRRGKILKIIPLADAKKDNRISVFTGNDPELIPDTDEIITQVVPVRFADATQLKRDLAPLVPDYADLSANASTNTIIITDTAANVRRIVQIIRDLDTSVSAVTRVQVFPLKYANAANAARLLTDIFKQDTTTTGPGGGGGRGQFLRQFFQGGGGAPSPDATRPPPKVTASSDDRTNTVVVSAPNDVMPVIEDVLKKLDENPAQNETVFIYALRNGDATNISNVINSLFAPSGTATPTTARPTTGTTAGTTNNGASGLGSFGGGNGGRGGGGGGGGGGFGGISGTGGFGNNSTALPGSIGSTASAAIGRPGGAASSANAADLAGQVFAVPDTYTNSVLVMTGSINVDRVKSVIEKLDRPVQQVLIKALLAQVAHSNNSDIGVEFSALNLVSGGSSNVFSSFGVGNTVTAGQGTPGIGQGTTTTVVGGTQTVITGAAAIPAVPPLGQGGLLFRLIQGDYQVALEALATVGKLDVLSRPYILCSDNQQASIIVGQNVPYITGSDVTDTGGIVNIIQYQNIGIILTITPHINPEGIVVMDVAPQISAIDPSTTVQISTGVNATVFDVTAAQTRVAIHDGQTIVIGGLMQDKKSQTLQKVPVLGDIPYLGLLFQNNSETVTKTELLIFLTPHVAPLPEHLQGMSNDERKGWMITPKAVEPGMFQEHMRDMQLGEDKQYKWPTTQSATQPAWIGPTTKPAQDPATQPFVY